MSTQLGLVRLETGSGIVPVELERDPGGKIVFGWMQQPVPTVDEVADGSEIFAALGVEGSEVPVERYDNGAVYVLVGLPSEAVVVARGEFRL